jgi:hypothetical protein
VVKVQPAEGRKPWWRPTALAGIGVAMLTLVGYGVWASALATATASHNVSSDNTLNLSMTNDGVGLSTSITNMAIGDVVNRHIVLTNGADSGGSLTLGIVATGAANLITDGTAGSTTKALKITITSCAVSWTETTGVCSSGSTVLLASTVLSSLGGTPVTLVASTITVGQVFNLQVKVQLPDQSETTTEGVPPANTVESLTANLTYSFGVTQRAAATTSS